MKESEKSRRQKQKRKTEKRREALALSPDLTEKEVWTEYESRMRKMRETMTLKEIAAVLGISHGVIHEDLARLGVAAPPQAIRKASCCKCGKVVDTRRMISMANKVVTMCPACAPAKVQYDAGENCWEVPGNIQVFRKEGVVDFCKPRHCPGCRIRGRVLEAGFIPENFYLIPACPSCKGPMPSEKCEVCGLEALSQSAPSAEHLPPEIA